MKDFTQCCKCGTQIMNVITIDGKPYGTECATNILGIEQLPLWFKGGDWNSAKLAHDENERNQINELKNRKEITSKYWTDFIRLSRALRKARNKGNDWEVKFINNISSQCGFYTLINEGCEFDTMEEAEIGWKPYMGTFPYLVCDIKGICGLSDRQIEILEKIENKY